VPDLSSPAPRASRLRRLGLLATVVLGIIALTVAVASPTLAAADDVIDRVGDTFFDVPELPAVDTPAQRSALFAADGTRIGYLVGEQNRDVVGLDEIAPVLVDAVVATEDARFYEHDGVAPKAMLRALWANVTAGEVEEGGSTITQQYVKNALLTPEQTLERKLREAVYAVEIEDRLSKDEILERYLNIAYFGNGAYGVEAAAERYYGIDASELDLAQAAILAGSIRAPEVNNPLDDPERAARMRDVVVGQMLDQGLVDQAEADEALAADIESLLDATPPPPPEHPFFVQWVKERLLASPALGETRQERAQQLYAGGLRIETTLVPELQDLADAAIRERLEDPASDPMAGLVSVEPATGRVRVLSVGPEGFGECDGSPGECVTTKVNPLVPGLGGSGRQVGSTFKPILDAAALEQGRETSWEASTRSGREIEGCIDHVDGEETAWTPENYSREGRGVLDMPAALRLSNNVYHAALIADVGPGPVVDTAHRLGIDSDIPERCAIALGAASAFPVDMAEAFAALANGGVRCTPYVIEEVTTPSGDTLLDPEPGCERAVSEETADTMVTMLREVVERGTATRAQIDGWDVAGKTGTTNGYRDAWFVGMTDPLVTASWVGYRAPREMADILGYAHVAGGTVPAEIWRDYMAPALEAYEPADLPTVELERGDGDPTDNGEDEPDREPSPTETGTASPSPTETATSSPSPSPTPTETATSEPSPSPTETATSEPSPSPTETATSEPSPSPTETATSEPSPSPTETATSEPSPSPTETATSEPSPSPSPTTTSTSDGDSTSEPTSSPSPSPAGDG
jgi:penicillin-binding protein 1A